MRPVEPFRPARLQKKHQQPVGIARHPANNISPKETVLADAFDGPPERLHLQPVRRLLKRIRPSRGEIRISMTAVIDT